MKLAVIGGSRQADELVKKAEKLGIDIDPTAEIIVIAAHPFDTDLIECALLSARQKKFIILQRPMWKAGSDDVWYSANSASAAAALLASLNVKRALLAVGNGRLAPFYHLEDIALYVRSRNAPHPPTPPKGEICPMRGPFGVESEILWMRDNRIDALVAHNAGGDGGWPKLAAARALGLPVVLINRPEPPKAPIVETVDEALSWFAALTGLDLGQHSP